MLRSGMVRGGIYCVLMGFAFAGHADTVTRINATPGYFDNSSGTRAFVFNNADFPSNTPITDVNISIDFEKYDGETLGVNGGGTPFYNEINFRLDGPSGTEVGLIPAGSFSSGSGGFRGVITFDDAASQVVNFDVNSPHAGTYRPVQSLSAFDGQTAPGTWTLFIQDTAGADHLGFYSATLEVTTADSTSATPTPLPTAALGGISVLGGTGLIRRCRRKR